MVEERKVGRGARRWGYRCLRYDVRSEQTGSQDVQMVETERN